MSTLVGSSCDVNFNTIDEFDIYLLVYKKILIEHKRVISKIMEIFVNSSQLDLLKHLKNKLEPELPEFSFIIRMGQLINIMLRKYSPDHRRFINYVEMPKVKEEYRNFPIENILRLIDMTDNPKLCYYQLILENNEEWNKIKQLNYEKNCIADYCKELGRKKYLQYFMMRSCKNRENCGDLIIFDIDIIANIVSFL